MKRFAPVFLILLLASFGAIADPPPAPTYDVTHSMADSVEADWLGKLGERAAGHYSDWQNLEARRLKARQRFRDTAKR